MDAQLRRAACKASLVYNRLTRHPAAPVVRCSNVLIDEEGRACLADLALAKVLASQPARTAAGATYTYAGEHGRADILMLRKGIVLALVCRLAFGSLRPACRTALPAGNNAYMQLRHSPRSALLQRRSNSWASAARSRQICSAWVRACLLHAAAAAAAAVHRVQSVAWRHEPASTVL